MAPDSLAPFAKVASEVARALSRAARISRDGDVYWNPPGRAHRRSQLGPQLYAGTLGVALTLAAMARTLDDHDSRDLCLRALRPLRQEIRELAGDRSRWSNVLLPIGGLSGLGSIVYSLVRIGELLGDPELSADALHVVTAIDAQRIAADTDLDVMLGCAGAILALVVLDNSDLRAAGPQPHEIARACALHLATRHDSACRPGSRQLIAGRDAVTTGFCHGTAGMTTALLRLYERIGGESLLATARKMIEWECPDDDDPRFMNPECLRSPAAVGGPSWCKGAGGFALGRISALRSLGDPSLDREARAALTAAATLPLSETDDLCCGNGGRIDVLLHAARQRKDRTLYLAAVRLATETLDRAEQRGTFALPLHTHAEPDVRLFPGLAGIGYTALRLLAPDLPCVLAME